MLDRSLDAVGRIIIHLLFFGGIFKDDVLVRAKFIRTITELFYHVYAGTLDIRLLSSWPLKSSFMLSSHGDQHRLSMSTVDGIRPRSVRNVTGCARDNSGNCRGGDRFYQYAWAASLGISVGRSDGTGQTRPR